MFVKTIATIVLFSLSAEAYIPKLRTIVQNMAEKRASRSSLLSTEVVFKTKDDKIVINEKWYIKDSENILLVATGPGFKYISLHKDGKRYRQNKKGQIVSATQEAPFYMPAFVSSDPNVLAQYFVDIKVADARLMKKLETQYKLEEIVHKPEENIRLTRLDGKTHYGVGIPMPKNSNIATSQVWILQDQFLLSKIRFDNYVITAEDYTKYKQGFWFPKKISTQWLELTAEAATISLEALTVGPKTKKKFQLSFLQEEKTNFEYEENPTYAEIEKFYLRFR